MYKYVLEGIGSKVGDEIDRKTLSAGHFMPVITTGSPTHLANSVLPLSCNTDATGLLSFFISFNLLVFIQIYILHIQDSISRYYTCIKLLSMNLKCPNMVKKERNVFMLLI